MKLFKDPAKIAKATGMDLQKFNKVLKEDTNEALIMLLEQLNKLGNIDVLAPVFADMGTDGARASGVLAALAGNVDMLKQQQLAANKAFKEGTSVTKEFGVQNNTVQAGLDKAKKRFHEMAVELGEKLAPAMKYAVTGTSAMMKVLSKTVTFFSKWAATILSTAAAIGIYVAAVNMSIIVDKLKIFWNNAVVASFKKLWATIAANPWGALLAVVGLVIGALIDLKRKTDAVSMAERTLNDVRNQAKVKMAEEKQNIDVLMAAAKNMKLTYDEQKAAVDKLNKIIPNFNGKINAQTREFNYSTDALKAYNDQLQRLYELEGAKEKLKELGTRRAELIIEQQQARDAIEQENQRQRQEYANMAKNPANYATSQGGSAPASGYVSAQNAATMNALENNLKEINKELKDVDKTEKALVNAFGKDLQRDAVKNPAGAPPATPESNITAPHHETKEEKAARLKAEREAKKQADKEKRDAEKAARAAEKKAKEEFKKQIEQTSANLSKERETNLAAYKTGQMDYLTYLQKQQDALNKYYDARIKVYTDAGLEEDEDVAKLRLLQLEDQKKFDDKQLQLTIRDLQRQRDAIKTQLEIDSYTEGNDLFGRVDLVDQKKFEADLKFLQDAQAKYNKGTDEWAQYQEQIDDMLLKDKLDKQKKFHEQLSAWREAYTKLDSTKQRDLELAILDDYHKRGLIKEEEYQKIRKGIIEKYEKMDLEAKEFSDNGGFGDMIKTLRNAIVDLGKDTDDYIGKLEKIGAVAQASFSIMGAAMSSYSAYSAASRDLEIAQIEKRYDAEIKAAGDNNAKTKKLEDQKQKEIAKVKSKYNRQAMKIEIAQAVASMAMAAINAYASAAKIPAIGWIMAPIAASMALAAGALQIATIKKQHAAEEAGYYEGGFTGRDPNNRREVGVVHANEFVANHEAVANPAIRPLLNMIDTAQRNNTVGSLTSEDVSRALGQGAVLGDFAVAQQRAAAGEDKTALVVAAMGEQTQAVKNLNEAIEHGIESYMVMDGERGFERYWERYQRMKSNPQR